MVWELPPIHEEIEGVPADAAWWMSFECLCEACRAICAYGGYASRFQVELGHVLGHDHLAGKLFWLESDLSMHRPEAPEDTVPLEEVATMIERVTPT